MLAWGIVSLGLCIYFAIVVDAAADEIVEEIPTGLLEKFRKAEEAKERHLSYPDYGAAGPAMPWTPGQPMSMPAAPVMGPPSGQPVHFASVPATSPVANMQPQVQANPFSTAANLE